MNINALAKFEKLAASQGQKNLIFKKLDQKGRLCSSHFQKFKTCKSKQKFAQLQKINASNSNLFPLKNDSLATKKWILLQITLFGNLSFAFEILSFILQYSTVFIKSIQKMTRWHKCTQQIQFKSIIFCWPLKGFCCEQRQLATSPLCQQFASLYIVYIVYIVRIQI